MTDGKAPDKKASAEEQAAQVLMRRARRKIPEYHASEELNLVPYLDVNVNLIIFLLVAISTVLPLAMLSIFPLTVKSSEAAAPQETPKNELTLTVFITHQGFTVAGRGGVLPPIPLAAEQKYDYDALQRVATEVKDAYPNETLVILAAEKDIEYDIVVKTMDTLRNKEQRILFPDVQLSPGIVGITTNAP